MKKSQHQSNLTWFFGFSIIVSCGALQVTILPYIDMTLISISQATAIAAGVFLSIFWLGEPLVPKYDLPALFLIIGGSVGLMFVANKEPTLWSFEELNSMVRSRDAYIYYSTMLVFAVITFISYTWVMKALTRFEI
jgi:hypothetical protein